MAQNILVVDDDRLNRELLSKVLRQEGYQVLEACDVSDINVQEVPVEDVIRQLFGETHEDRSRSGVLAAEAPPVS